MTDSTGVTVIAYRSAFDFAGGRSWSLHAQPDLVIGEPTVELYSVRAARFQSDGDIMVADGGARELLLFDTEGNLRSRAGGEGEGPGEFTMLADLSVGPADSLYVYDGRTRRLSVFDESGSFARSLTVEGHGLGRITDVRVLSTGHVVVAFHRRTDGAGLIRDSLVVARFDLSGNVLDTVGTFPHSFTHWGPHSLPGETGPITMPAPVALSPLTIIGTGHSILYIGLADRYELIRIDEHDNGRVTRQQHPLPLITDAHRDSLFTRLAAGGRVGPEEEFLRELAGPTTVPAFGDEPLTQGYDEALIVTDVGGVWVRPFALDGSASSEWPRFGPDGRYEGTVTVPSSFRPTDVRGDVVLGVHRDRQDVESVRVFRVVEVP